MPTTAPVEVAAAPGYCLRKLTVAAAAAVPLLPKTCVPALNRAAAFTVRVLPLLLPNTVLLLAVNSPATVSELPYVTAALKVAAALTVSMSVALLPTVVLLLAVNVPATMAVLVILTAALNSVAALTVSVLVLLLPKMVLPLQVRVLLVLARVTEAEKLARPELSIVRRSVGVVPAAVLDVLKIRLPPFCWLAPESCSKDQYYN